MCLSPPPVAESCHSTSKTRSRQEENQVGKFYLRCKVISHRDASNCNQPDTMIIRTFFGSQNRKKISSFRFCQNSSWKCHFRENNSHARIDLRPNLASLPLHKGKASCISNSHTKIDTEVTMCKTASSRRQKVFLFFGVPGATCFPGCWLVSTFSHDLSPDTEVLLSVTHDVTLRTMGRFPCWPPAWPEPLKLMLFSFLSSFSINFESQRHIAW